MSCNEFQIIGAQQSGFKEALLKISPSNLAEHPRLSEFGREYYPLALGRNYIDCSFILLDKGMPAAATICGRNGEIVSQFGAPVAFHLVPGLNSKKKRRIFRNLITHMKSITEGEKEIHIADKVDVSLSALGEVCLSSEYKVRMHVMASVDLMEDVNNINRGIRKSYRSMINWGRKNLHLEYVNSKNPSWEMFQEYQKFHNHISGRVTRPQSSWDIMFKAIQNNSGELALGYEAGILVSGALFIDGANVSVYASGVYERSKFDRPLAHWILYDGIIRAKQRGKKTFELGLVDKGSNASQKEMQIAKFKRGFASRLLPEITWVIPIGT